MTDHRQPPVVSLIQGRPVRPDWKPMTRLGIVVAIAIAVTSHANFAKAQEAPAAPAAAESTPAAMPSAETPAPQPVPAEAPQMEIPAPASPPAVPVADSNTAAPEPQPTAPAPATEPDTATHAATPAIDPAHLPRDLSPWAMFMAADLVVKSVMIGLAFASIVTWTVWLAKSIELAWAKRKLARASQSVSSATSLSEARKAVDHTRGVVPGLLAMAETELRLSQGISDKAGIKERVASRLDGLTLSAGRDMNTGTGVLATIGSTAPFVGLFGTVWGIMNSFIGISEAQTTNLAIVAPGIAEALLATAIGLVAAIPAVIIYNQFARSISAYKAVIAEASAEVMRLVSRDLDRGFKIMAARAAE